jgi:hypothetical protein
MCAAFTRVDVIGWTVRGGEIRASGPEGADVRIRAPDWRGDGRARELPGPTDAVAAGTAARLEFPAAPGRVRRLDRDDRARTPPREVSDGPALLTVEASICVHVRFEGPGTVAVDDDGELSLSLPDRTPVTVGFASRTPAPTGRVTTPPTPRGLAAALTAAAATPVETGAERSRPSARPHPPLFAFDPEVDPPESDPGTGLELRVPPDPAALFVAAPLAYYAGARVTVADDATPQLRAADADLDVDLDPVADRAPALFRRAVRLDCLVREGDPRCGDLGVDADALRSAPPADRLAAYLDADPQAAGVALPDWALAAYVEPTMERATALPHLLARLAAIHPPETQPLDGKALMERCLDDFYRGDPIPNIGPEEAPSVAVCEATLAEADLHAWLAPEVPIEVFDAPESGFEHRLSHGARRREGPLRAAVVCNESRMDTEGDDVVTAYRDGVCDAFEVTHHRNLSTRDLAAVLESDFDLLHFVGHCGTGGLVCPDGTLAVEDVTEVRIPAVLLNACGSYYEGVDLVERGAVAAGITYRKVLDDQAARVGTTFARLLARGFGIARALELARRRVRMGKDYAVVGDGTHAVVEPTAPPLVARIDTQSGSGDRYRVVVEAAGERRPGGCFRPPFPGAEPRLCGDAAVTTLGGEELADVCATRASDVPTVYDGEFLWGNEVATKLS